MKREAYTNYHWSDTKRIMGMPISFTYYTLTDTALHITTGFFTRRTTDILLYRIDGTGHDSSLFQRIANQGTIKITCMDQDMKWKTFYIQNVKAPADVKDMILKLSEESKQRILYRHNDYRLSSADHNFYI